MGFYQLNTHIQKRKLPFLLFFILLFASLFYLASKTILVEDAAAILPQSENTKETSEVLQNIKLNERIFFNIYHQDSSKTHTNNLIRFARQLEDSLNTLPPEYLNDIALKVQDKSVEKVGEYVLRNLPFLCEESDFVYFDSLLYGQSLKKSFRKKYKTLMSPASSFTKQLVLKDPAGLSLLALQRLQNFQLGSKINIKNGYLFSEDQSHLLGYITLKIPSSKTSKVNQLIESIEGIIASLKESYPEIEAEYFGAPVVAAGNATQIKKDIILTVSMAIVMVVLLIAMFYRSKRLYAIIFLPAILAVVASMAVLYLIQGEISAIALGMGSVLVGISIDYVLHIFTHQQQMNSLKKVLSDVAEPILVSAATTASAFFGLMVVSAPALRDMGLFAGISILFSALFTLVFIPLFLKKTDGKQKKSRSNGFQKGIFKITSFPFHEKWVLILIILVLSPVLYYFSQSVTFQGDMNAINFMTEKTRKAEQHLNEISQISQRNVFVVSRSQDMEEALQQSEVLENKLRAEADNWGVLQFSRVSDILPSKKLQQQKLDNWKQYWTEERKQILIAKIEGIEQQYGFKSGSFKGFLHWLNQPLNEINERDEQFIVSNMLSELVQANEQHKMIITQIKTTTEQKKHLNTQLSQNLSSGLFLIDKEYLTTQFVDQLKRDFQLLVSLSLLIVFLIIWAAFGRIELALITYLPLSLSWMWTTGLMALFGFEFNIVNIIISTFIFGLGIDYCIFITRGLMQEYKYGASRLESFKTSILFSAFTSIAGIGVLIFAQHPALKSMAFVTIIGLASVILLSFTLQPLLFNWIIYARKGEKRLVPITAWNFLGSIVAILFFSIGSLINTIAGIFLISLTGGKVKRFRLWFHYLLQITSKMLIYVMINVKKELHGYDKNKFEKPSLVICNHQSHIDIMFMLMLHPKMIILTNDWVQRNFFYGKIVKMADFYPILDHLYEHIDLLKSKVEEGYSIMIFPEGTRSRDGKIGRFHKGAFYIAEQLSLDITAVILHGPGDCITKGEPFLKNGRIDLFVKDRIAPDHKELGGGYVERSKKFRKWYQQEYDAIKAEIRTANYLRKQVDMHYIYKGPVLEWYAKIKMNFEKNYQFFHEQIGEEASIVDLGCGNAMMDYMLLQLSPKRSIYGVDYDEEKIAVASNVSIRERLAPQQIQFEAADLNHWNYRQADVYILADVLHYMPLEEQKNVIERSVAHLNPGGKIIIRDGDTDLQEKHKGTKFSEWQSTKVFGFNKTQDDSKQLYFGSAHERRQLLEQLGLKVHLVDQTKMNSNVILIGEVV